MEGAMRDREEGREEGLRGRTMADVGYPYRGAPWGTRRPIETDSIRDTGDAARYEREAPYPAQRGMDQNFSLDRRAYGNPVRNRISDEGAGSPGPIRGAIDRLLEGATKQDRALRRSLLFCVVVLAFSMFVNV